MKKVLISMAASVALSSLVVAGGDIAPVEPVVDTPMVASSEGNFYAGLALSEISTRGSSVSLDFFSVTPGQDRLGNITFQAGYEFNPYVAVEGRYTTTLTNEDLVSMDGWSLFVKPQYPVNDAFTVYALLGYGGVSVNQEGALPVNVDDSGFQWGLGVSYDIMNNLEIFFDYTQLANDMDGLYWNGDLQADADALTIGVTYTF